MKKLLLTLLLSGCLLLTLTACGGEETSAETNTTETTEDALHEISQEEMVEATGIDLPAPEGAQNVTYHVLSASSESPIAEMDFMLDGQELYLRAQSTGFLPDSPDADATLEDITSSMDLTSWDISGLYFTADAQAVTYIQDNYPGMYWTGEGYSVLGWVDEVPGILYNLCSTNGMDSETLQTTADTVFVPLQGEADGDAEAPAE